MTRPRKEVVDPDIVANYHCSTCCVRRAFLCGEDPLTGRSFSHRKGWVRDYLERLSQAFAFEVCTYSVLSNHYHLVLRARPDLAKQWSDLEVARRWRSIYGSQLRDTPEQEAAYQHSIVELSRNSEKIATYRERLRTMGVMMGKLNQTISRWANKEDDCTGRFWGERYGCKLLKDEGATLACMEYVDLNPVRAAQADSLRDSDYTGIQDRILAAEAQLASPCADPWLESRRLEHCHRADWLVDISAADSPLPGLKLENYLWLTECTGQQVRADKPGSLPHNAKVILEGYSLNPENWISSVDTFGESFHYMVGPWSEVKKRARQVGKRWFWGKDANQSLYASSKN